MKLDMSILREFAASELTAKATRSYLTRYFQSETTSSTSESSTFAEEAQTLLAAADGNGFKIDEWERIFLSDNVDNGSPSISQQERLAKIIRRYRKGS